MQYAVIENGTIVNVVHAEADFAAEIGWVAFPAYINEQAVGIGWTFDGTNFAPPLEPEPIVAPTEPTKEELLAQINALAAQVQAFG